MMRLALLLVLVAAGVAVASLTVPADVATVNGVGITQSTLEGDLQTIATHPELACFLQAEYALTTGQASPPAVAGVGETVSSSSTSVAAPATYSTAFADFWLDQLLYAQVERSRLPLTSYERHAGSVLVTTEINGVLSEWASSHPTEACTSGSSAPAAGLLASIPASFRTALVTDEAEEATYSFAATGQRLNAAAVSRYVAANRHGLQQICYVELPVPNASDVAEVEADVAKGDNFVQLAEQNGGGSQCAPRSSLPSEVTSLKPDQLSPALPDGTEGYALVEVVSTVNPSAAQDVPTALEMMLQGQVQTAGPRFEALFDDSHIAVDPRYGRWVRSKVVPPDSPPAADVLCPLADEPQLVGSPVTCPAAAAHSTGARGKAA